jgi:hypothetical protein
MTPVQCPTVAGQKISQGIGYKAATCCKSLGTGISGKGLCLGLGLGAGIWGPIALVGIGVAGGYFYWKKASKMLD